MQEGGLRMYEKVGEIFPWSIQPSSLHGYARYGADPVEHPAFIPPRLCPLRGRSRGASSLHPRPSTKIDYPILKLDFPN